MALARAFAGAVEAELEQARPAPVQLAVALWRLERGPELCGAGPALARWPPTLECIAAPQEE